MPSLSPGQPSNVPPAFSHIAPGAPASSRQAFTTLTYRWKRYILYISGRQLNILRSATDLAQALTFDEELVAVKAEDTIDGLGNGSGRIAVAGKRDVWILEPITVEDNRVTWRKGRVLKREDEEDGARTLSWGNEGEVLVGGSKRLSLFSTVEGSRESSPVSSTATLKELEERTPLWMKELASPVSYAKFSPSASLIATCGVHDRLVKIWRRLSFEDALFDYAYLPHPGMVTHLEWRRPDPPVLEGEELGQRRGSVYSVRHEEELEVLHTFCTDGVMRVWKTGGHHDLDVLTLHTSIDLVGAIPSSPALNRRHSGSSARPARYAFLLNSGALSSAITAALSKTALLRLTHAQEHLKDLRSKHPDVVIALNGRGRMSAWGFASPGQRHRRPSTPSKSATTGEAFHVAHTEDLGIRLEDGENVRFESWFDGDEVNVLVHGFEGSVQWWKGGVEGLFSPGAVGAERMMLVADWSGVGEEVARLARSIDDEHLLSWTGSGSWRAIGSHSSRTRHRVSDTRQRRSEPWLSIAATGRDDLAVIAFTAEHVMCFDADGKVVGARTSHDLDAASIQVMLFPRPDDNDADNERTYLCYDRTGAWLTVVASSKIHNATGVEITTSNARRVPSLGLEDGAEKSWSQAVVVLHPRKPCWLRIVCLGGNGIMHRRDISAMQFLDASERSAEPALLFQTNLQGAVVFDANSSHAALVSRPGDELVILDLKDGFVEHRRELQQEGLKVSFAPRAGGPGSLLAISYNESVDIMAETHYEPNSADEHCTWQHVKSVSIAGTGLTTLDIAWTATEQIAIAAGNSVLIANGVTAGSELSEALRDRLDLSKAARAETHGLATLLKHPLAIWHPHSLLHMSLKGHLHAALETLRRLEHRLRFLGEGDIVHPTFEDDPTVLSAMLLSASMSGLEASTVTDLQSQLDSIDLPRTSKAEQVQLKCVIQTLAYVQEHANSLDANALRYLLIWKLRTLQIAPSRPQSRRSLSNGNRTPSPGAPTMTYREILLAQQSTTQQPLLELLTAHYGPTLSCDTARALGLPLWLRELHAPASEGSALASLDQLFESLAQSAYRSVYPPDPAKAALYFLALRKQNTLLALWRVAVGNKEQRATVNFLKRDFALDENRTAAKKNAYALMGKRRFEYAAAFFLLAGDCQSAVRVLAGQCEDIGLAVGVARCFAGDDSAVLKDLVKRTMLPRAQDEGDRWCMAWCHSMLHQPKGVAKALIAPMRVLRENLKPSPRYWQQDDPLTLTLYENLRSEAKKSGKPSKQLGAAQWEYEAVLRSARIMRRMGLLLQAMELVRTWVFVAPDRTLANGEDEQHANGVSEPAEAQRINGEDEPAATEPLLATADQAGPPVKSLLDEFDAAPTPSPLDVSATSTPAPAQDAAKIAREAKAAELLAKMKAKKAAAANQGGEERSTKEKPTHFDEPAASSILDSFGF